MRKFMSGRYILTLVSAAVFMIMSIHGKLSGEAVTSILSMVFALYFSKDRKEAEDGGQN